MHIDIERPDDEDAALIENRFAAGPRVEQRTIFLIAVIILIGVVSRLLYVAIVPPRPDLWDQRSYVDSARTIVEEGSFEKVVELHVCPVVPLLYAGLFTIVEPGYQAPRYFQCFLFVIGGVVFFLLGKELAGRIGGLLCLLICSLHPYFIYWTGYAMTESTAIIVVPAVILFAVRSVRTRSLGDSILFGVALAVATLTRSAVLAFTLAIPLVYLIGWGFKNVAWLRSTAVALGAFLLVYSPWMLVNYRYFRSFIPSPTIGSGLLLYQTGLRITMPDDEERWAYVKSEILHKYHTLPGRPPADRLAGDEYLKAEGVRMIKENPSGYARIVWYNFKRFWQFYPGSMVQVDSSDSMFYRTVGLLSYGVFFPFIILGLGLGLRRFSSLSALYGFIIYYTLVHALLYGILRYRLPMDPVLYAFAALGIRQVLAWLAPGFLARFERMMAGAPCTPCRS